MQQYISEQAYNSLVLNQNINNNIHIINQVLDTNHLNIVYINQIIAVKNMINDIY